MYPRGSSCLLSLSIPKQRTSHSSCDTFCAVELDLIPTAKLLFDRNDLQLLPFPFCRRLGPTAPCWQPQTGYYTPQAFLPGGRASKQSFQVTSGLPATPPFPESTKKVEGHSEPRGHAWGSGCEGDALSLWKHSHRNCKCSCLTKKYSTGSYYPVTPKTRAVCKL